MSHRLRRNVFYDMMIDVTRKNKMLLLRFEEGQSLQMIANKFKISRQRVQQIIGNTGINNGGFNYHKINLLDDQDFLLLTSNKTNEELSRELGLGENTISSHRSKIRHAIKKGDTSVSRGFDGEEWASEWLKYKGISNQLMNFKHTFDILAFDKIRIDVKYATIPWGYSSRTWRFHVKQYNKRHDCDFYLFIIAKTEDVFVIPATKIPEKQKYVVLTCPTSRPTLFKWEYYHNAYDLIINQAEQIT